jgi:uncharacterized protein YjiS (DUF1127 family)
LNRVDVSIDIVPQRARLLPALAAGIRAARATLVCWHLRVRYRRALAQMSERELADTGVCWPQIAEEASKPFWRE